MKRKKWFIDTLPLILFTIIPLFIINCAQITSFSRSGTSDTSELSRQFKLTFKPDITGASFTDKDISEFFQKAKETGLELDYTILSINQEKGKITFIKNGKNGKFPIEIEVVIEIIKNRSLAYVYIKVSSKSQIAVDSAISGFNERYKSKFN